MLNESNLNKIKKLYAEQYFIQTGTELPNELLDLYIREQYIPVEWFFVDDNNFFTYKTTNKYVWIQDFISDNAKKAYKMLLYIIELNKKNLIKAQVSLYNIKMINILLRSGFKITSINGYTYQLVRS